MDHLTNLLWRDGKFLGVVWSVWKVVGWLDNVFFSARFVVQWYVTEKRKQVVVPSAFWWLSLVGSLLLLTFALHQRSSVFIFACAFNWIPFIRNLIIHRRHKEAYLDCPSCGISCAPQSNFCAACGTRLVSGANPAAE